MSQYTDEEIELFKSYYDRAMQRKGSGSSGAKLTDEQVIEIKKHLKTTRDLHYGRIGEIYNVTRCVVGDIHRGRTWSHIKV